MSIRSRHAALLSCYLVGLLVLGLWTAVSVVSAEDAPASDASSSVVAGLQELLPGAAESEIAISAKLTEGESPGELVLHVEAELSDGWHLYGINQPTSPSPAPIRTVISVPGAEGYQLGGQFQAETAASVEPSEFFAVDEHHHEGRAAWTAPVHLKQAIDANELQIAGRITGQVCHPQQGCVPFDLPFVATGVSGLTGPLVAASEETLSATVSGRTRGPKDKVSLVGQLIPGTAKPGEVLQLSLTATPDEGWHFYGYDHGTEEAYVGYQPTLIVLQDAAGLYAHGATASKAPEMEEVPHIGIIPTYHHEVTWTVPIAVPQDFTGDTYSLEGYLAYQVCDEGGCLTAAVRFTAEVPLGGDSAESIAVIFDDAEIDYPYVLNACKEREKADWPKTDLPEGYQAATSNAKQFHPVVYLIFALLAGLMLNVMPCVLPVIGLKIMSFVQQAGEDRKRVLALNLWYSAGLISVFAVLATMVVLVGMNWSSQFQSSTFNIVLVIVLFVFGLSFMGVWEVPIPGFLGSGKSAELASREGYGGAFIKGAFTTVLATPCTGPLFGPVLAWGTNQDAWLNYSVFLLIGVGMAIPYLLIGAFPALIRFLPKPGAWMDTFKQAMGFMLMAAGVWIFGSVAPQHVIPTLATLVGLGAGCWMIGKISITATLKSKAKSWACACGLALTVAFVGFYGPFKLYYDITHGTLLAVLMGEDRVELPWQPFSPESLEELRAEGTTVLIDFTADW